MEEGVFAKSRDLLYNTHSLHRSLTPSSECVYRDVQTSCLHRQPLLLYVFCSLSPLKVSSSVRECSQQLDLLLATCRRIEHTFPFHRSMSPPLLSPPFFPRVSPSLHVYVINDAIGGQTAESALDSAKKRFGGDRFPLLVLLFPLDSLVLAEQRVQ